MPLTGEIAKAQIRWTVRIAAYHAGGYSMTPYLGKGATSAMADALLLAEKLQHSVELENDSQLEQVLKDYEARMLADGFKLCHASMRIHRLVYSWGSNRLKAACRNRLILALDWAMHLDRGEIWWWIGAFIVLLLLVIVTHVVVRVTVFKSLVAGSFGSVTLETMVRR